MKQSILTALVIMLFVIGVMTVGNMQKDDLQKCEAAGYSKGRCLEMVAR